MSELLDSTIEQLLDTEDKNLKKIHQIIMESLQEEKLLVQRLYQESNEDNLTAAQRLADRVASFGGSWRFIILFGVCLVSWMLFNSYITKYIFDPYPFILLNLILSCLAAIQAPVIMMSQNRREYKDRVRAEHDYHVNLKAELEIRGINKKIDILIIDQMNFLLKLQKEQHQNLNNLKLKLEDHLNSTKLE